MANLPTPAEDSGVWGAELNEFLRVSHNEDGTLIGGGGTGGTGGGGVLAVEKSSSFTVQPDDNGKRFIVTATATITVPQIGTLGTGWSCEVLNDSDGDTIVIDGTGTANVSLTVGQLATVYEVGGKQRVVVRTTSGITTISDVQAPPADLLWTPNIFGADPRTTGLDLCHWWDTSDPALLGFDPTTGKLSQWIDKVDTSFSAVQTVDTKRPTVTDGEVRFEGPGVCLTSLTTFTRTHAENRWFFMLFRIDWTASGAGTAGKLFCANGVLPKPSSGGRSQPLIEYNRSTQSVSISWMHGATDGSDPITNSLPVPISDDQWHTLLGRRVPSGAYISVDGAPETFIPGNGCCSAIPTQSVPTGFIGDQGNASPLFWGLDTWMMGQKTPTATEREKLHAWGLHRRGAQAQLPVGSPYLVDPPMSSADEVHHATPDSYSTGFYMSDPHIAAWDTSVRGNALNLTGFTLEFEDHFTSMTVKDGTDNVGPWYAPADRVDTTFASFASPLQAPLDTFTLYDSTTLAIKFQQTIGFASSKVRTYTGHMQTVNAMGETGTNGFKAAVPPGPSGAMYFEARMSFSDGAHWPAFWTYTPFKDTNTTISPVELDIMECYGSNPTSKNQQHITVHRHEAYRPQWTIGNQPRSGGVLGSGRSPSNLQNMSEAPWFHTTLFDGDAVNGIPGTFHTYGMMVDRNWITFYHDGFAIDRFTVFPEALGEQFLLITLQGLTDAALVTGYLWVDYVRAYLHT